MTDQRIDEEALGWALRMAEPDADWDAFTQWLEGDATRAERYDRAAVAMLDLDGLPAVEAQTLTPAPEPVIAAPARGLAPAAAQRHGRRWTPWLGAAVAATVTAAVGLGVWTEMPRPYAIETANGEQRTVALADGSSIVLAGGTRVRLDHADARTASLERGEALFRVRHDVRHPFTVAAGELRLVDLGTLFDVKASGTRTVVGVAEGAVMVDPDGARLRLDPGQAVIATGSSLQRATVEPAAVGGWRDGRLAYDDAPLAEVAADLTRQLGRRVVASPAIATRTFHGTLDVGTVRDRPALLGQLLGVTVQQQAGDWILDAAP